MNTATSSSVAVSRGRRCEKRIMPSGRRGADDDHQAEHEQRVSEDRADDRGLGDHQLALLQRKHDHEQLGQVAERGLQHAGDGRARSARRAARSRTTPPRRGRPARAWRPRSAGPPARPGSWPRRRAPSVPRSTAAPRARSQSGHSSRVHRAFTAPQAASVALEDAVDQAVLLGLLGREEAVALHVLADLLGGAAVCSA